MAGTYFDAVLNTEYDPIFNGTPEETKAFLKEHGETYKQQGARVCHGSTLRIVSIDEYLNPTPEQQKEINEGEGL